MQFRFGLAVVLAGFLVIGQAPAYADKLHTSCTTSVADEKEDIVCQIRSSSGKQPTSVSAELASGRDITGENEAYQWTKNRSAWYYIVQKTGASEDEFRRMVEFLGRAAFIVGRQSVGVGTFDDRLEERASLGSFRTQLDRVYRDMRNESPQAGTPSMLQAARDAIAKLKDHEADRKAIVLLVNGYSSGSGPSRQDIIDLARQNNIAIFTVYFGNEKNSPPEVLSALANETTGEQLNYAGLGIDEIQRNASEFAKKLENGSIMTIPAAGLPAEPEITFTAQFEDGRELRSDAVRLERQTEDPWHVGISGMLADNLITILALTGLAMGAGLILTSMRRSRGRSGQMAPRARQQTYADDYDPGDFDDLDGNDETVILGPGDFGDAQPYGWLEMMDEDAPAVPIQGKVVRIGRHKDNDVRFTNGSVHRQHATLEITNKGRVLIRDLDTRNGVLVNGTRYAERELAEGDVVELGEVRLRFRNA